MKNKIFSIITVFFLSIASCFAQSKECSGVMGCSLEFALFADSEVMFDKKINFNILSLLEEGTTLSKENFLKEFESFLANNLLVLKKITNKKFEITSQREGIYNFAPIFLASHEEGIAPFINPKGEVTIVYKTKKTLKDLRGWSINRALKKVKLLELENNKIALSGHYEDARSAMELILKEDR